MCLAIDQDVTNRMLAEFAANNDEIIAYKFVYKNCITLYLSPFRGMSWSRGRNISNRPDTSLTAYEHSNREVYHGLHVSLDPNYFPSETLMPKLSGKLIRLKVRCKKEHFVAAGFWADDRSRSAVFTQVTVIGEADAPPTT